MGLSSVGSFASGMVCVVDGHRQGLCGVYNITPDGVCTDNVLWKEALFHREGNAPCSSATSSADTAHPTASAEVHEALPVSALADMANSTADTMTAYAGEGSGALAKPRSGNPQQPLDRHGTDDADEYGAVPPQSADSTVAMVGSVVGAEVEVASEQVEVRPALDGQKPCELAADTAREPATDDVLAFLVALEKRAVDCGIGPSEWYEVRNRPLLDVLHYVEALEQPTSTRIGSSN